MVHRTIEAWPTAIGHTTNQSLLLKGVTVGTRVNLTVGPINYILM